MKFLQSHVIVPGGRLRETGNKKIYQISGLKGGCGRLKYLRNGHLRGSFGTVFDWETKRLFI